MCVGGDKGFFFFFFGIALGRQNSLKNESELGNIIRSNAVLSFGLETRVLSATHIWDTSIFIYSKYQQSLFLNFQYQSGYKFKHQKTSTQ